MPELVDELKRAIRQATTPGFRRRLLARGEARGMIWRDGITPEGGQQFDPSLTDDLLGYGYALLEHGLELTDLDGSEDTARLAFRSAATAIESVIAHGPEHPERGFHRVVAAAAFHLARFSARAYSLLHIAGESPNTSLPEQCLVLLMMRDLDGLTGLVSGYRADPEVTDEYLTEQLQTLLEPSVSGNATANPAAPTEDWVDVVDVAFTDAFMGAVSVAMLAFERGERALLEDALRRLEVGVRGASTLGMVSQWWSHRLARYLLRALWESSFHQVLPLSPEGGDGNEWERLRATFIATLFRRSRAEIELWPSQLAAAARVLDTQDNLVLSLPTSAGKTRIAELCILATLAEGERAVIVTPLRALSAQTEQSLGQTFVPLGKTVSTLYGTTGVSTVDGNILQSRDIVVATPEKLDFALRNDPTLLDDVGLIVFDEGHMIGAGEREVRYEVQVQRLLRRSDAATRRIICLSAILPEGELVEDFVNWLTNDQPAGLISSDWRPTVLRYGEVVWRNDVAKLDIIVGDEAPFVPRFLEAVQPPSKMRKTTFPNTAPELTLATAWRLVEDGQTVLVFCPQKNSVTSLAKEVVKLNKQGALRDIFDGGPQELEKALTIGQEWFPEDHPILACLRLGVAVHHGSLPSEYRKEVEWLLQRGTLKVTISSPTLAQGLNLSASALVVHSIWRYGNLIEGPEFRNIVGRAGRAYVDSVGLVIHPMFQPTSKRRHEWAQLARGAELRDMQSGLVKLVLRLLERMALHSGIRDIFTFTEYVLGNVDWSFPEIDNEVEKKRESAAKEWQTQVATLDSALLGLLGDANVDDADVASVLDTLLTSSLWSRSLARYDHETQRGLRAVLTARAVYIWDHSTPAQRRGWYLAGVGMQTGQMLDTKAEELEALLQQSEAAIQLGMNETAVSAIIGFARVALKIFPFAPQELPENWEEVLEAWLTAKPITVVTSDGKLDVVDFVEGVLAYRLPWALEAVRVRATAQSFDNQFLDSQPDIDLGLTVAAVETGTLSRPTALLIRAGFNARSAAVAAIATTGADFTTIAELREWLSSDLVKLKESDPNWPTPSTHDLWREFSTRTSGWGTRTWIHETHAAQVTWNPEHSPIPGAAYRAVSPSDDTTFLETADARRAGLLRTPLNRHRRGLLSITSNTPDTVLLEYRGPSDLYR